MGRHVGVDLHTTNGTRHAYHVTYAPPLHPNTHPAIDSLLRDTWLPEVTDMVRERTGWEMYHYGNLPFRPGAERGWYTFDHRPRFNNNYIGLRNRVAILSEAYAYATFEERVLSTLAFVEAVLDFATDNADAVRDAVATAEAEPLPGTELAVRAEPAASDGPVEILLGEVELTTHPLTGRRVAMRTDARTAETMVEYVRFAPSETATVPTAYLVPAGLSAVIDRLRIHGVAMEAMEASEEMAIERFRITGSSEARREFQGHRERTLEGAWEPDTATIEAGTLRIDMTQSLARLAFTLLEPRSDDGLTNWNFLDDAIDGAEHYPILRVPATAER